MSTSANNADAVFPHLEHRKRVYSRLSARHPQPVEVLQRQPKEHSENTVVPSSSGKPSENTVVASSSGNSPQNATRVSELATEIASELTEKGTTDYFTGLIAASVTDDTNLAEEAEEKEKNDEVGIPKVQGNTNRAAKGEEQIKEGEGDHERAESNAEKNKEEQVAYSDAAETHDNEDEEYDFCDAVEAQS